MRMCMCVHVCVYRCMCMCMYMYIIAVGVIEFIREFKARNPRYVDQSVVIQTPAHHRRCVDRMRIKTYSRGGVGLGRQNVRREWL